MERVLYLQASPRGPRSKSIAVADAFLSAYTEARLGTTVTTVNLFDADLPAFDGQAAAGKYAIMHGTEADEATQAAFARVESVIETFKSQDLYLLAVPMWNFGIPYELKHYIDLVTQPGYTFGVTDEGYEGLLTEKIAVTIYARGGDYAGVDPAGIDFQKRYLDLILGFMGITDVHTVIAQPTLAGGPETATEAVADASAAAVELAGKLAAR
jgi:FMN-dependent NADH-azoreductase